MSDHQGKVDPHVRLAWLDYAKAIGIFLVVFGHASRSIERTQGLTWSEHLQALDGIIYAFHMPLFFLLAGYAASLQRAQASALFWKALFWGVAVPYLVWSAVWIGLKILMPDAANFPLDVSALGNILWQPVEHFWFLYHLFFIRAGWYLAGHVPGKGGVIQAALILLSAAAAAILLTAYPDLDWVAGFLRNFAIYGIGLVLLPPLLAHWSNGPSMRLVLLGVVLWMWGLVMGGAAANIWPAVGGSLAVAGLAMALPQPSGPVSRTFAYLGEASLAIYVMHLLAAAAMRIGLAKFGLLSEPVLLIAATVAGLLLPAFAYWCVLSMAQWKAPALPRFLGLGMASRSAYLTLWPGLKQPVTTN